MAQTLDSNDPTLITGVATIRNVNRNDAGAYSCEALNNQGFIFAVPDCIVTVSGGLYFCIVKKIEDFLKSFNRCT
jgi:hypothetical protein